MKPREIEIDSASVIRGSPEHRVPCVTSKVHGPRSSEPSCLRVNTRAHPSNEPIGAPLVVTRFFRHLIHLHAVIHITIQRRTGSFVSPASPDFPSSRFLPLRRDRKIRTMTWAECKCARV